MIAHYNIKINLTGYSLQCVLEKRKTSDALKLMSLAEATFNQQKKI